MRLGIDFGTTRTVVAASDRGNYPVVSFRGCDGATEEYFPSLVAERGGELCFGFQALERRGEAGWTLQRSFKRWLSSPEATPHRRVTIGSTEMELSRLVTLFLRALHAALRDGSSLGAVDSRAPFQVTVATPAGAFSTQRLVTLEAFREAGFEVCSMLDEPSAAGVEYAHRYRNTFSSRREKVVVYDLGGGTFDVSIVDMRGGAHDVMVSHGLSRLGGDDFDELLVQLALARVGVESTQLEPAALADLALHCREVKESIHPNTRRCLVDLSRVAGSHPLPSSALDADAIATVTVADFERACEPLLQETLELVSRTLRDSEKKPTADEPGSGASAGLDGFAGLYVVGGASALPTIARRLRSVFGRRVRRSPYPSAAIAIGLAIAADEGAPYELKHRLHHHFGVFRELREGRSVAFDRILGPDMTLPGAGAPAASLMRRYRATHNVGHYRFVECGWLDDEGQPSGDIKPVGDVLFPFDAQLHGRSDLREVPILRTGSGPEIEERYQVSEHGAVDLTIINRDAGYEQNYRIAD